MGDPYKTDNPSVSSAAFWTVLTDFGSPVVFAAIEGAPRHAPRVLIPCGSASTCEMVLIDKSGNENTLSVWPIGLPFYGEAVSLESTDCDELVVLW